MPGPLSGLRVVELSGIGPGPFAGMVLADLGADVLTVDRPAAKRPRLQGLTAADVGSPNRDPLTRSRRSIVVDLAHPGAAAVVLRLVEGADVFFEPFRPGVAERLGLGPDECLARNPGLVYGRITGWGQDGPLAAHAGHDINYIALAGALEGSGRAGDPPTFAQNLVGDFGGGAMLLVVGILSALYERARSGRGQVVDAAMVDGAAMLTSFVRGMRANGAWPGPRGTNLLDSGCHNYEVYETSDGKWVSIGANERPFYANLLRLIGLGEDRDLMEHQMDRSRWPEFKERLAAVFRTRTRDQWTDLLGGETELCFAPVLDLDEAPQHPHLRDRGTFIELAGVEQAAPAPRFSRTAPATPRAPTPRGTYTDEVLQEAGFDVGEIETLRATGTVA